MRNIESRVKKLEGRWLQRDLPPFIIYLTTEAGKEANVFKFHQGDDKLVSYPHESIEEFETRVRQMTDHRLIVICAEYVEPE
jgi:hypothetical protein